MSALITIVHVLICVVLIVAVLLQSGKAADLAGAFGGVGSQTAFGPRGTASLLSKITTIGAIMFMVTSLGLWILSGQEGKSAVSGVKPPAAAAGKTPAAQNKPAAAETKKDEKKAPATQPAEKPKTTSDKPSAVPPAKGPETKR